MLELEMNYAEVAHFVYELACADALEQNLKPIEIVYKGETWEIYNYKWSRDGSSPALLIRRESESWVFHSTFYYCRYAKKITGFKHEGWEKDQ